MPYKELDPEVIFDAIQGHENVLEGEQKKAEAFYRQFICPSCKGAKLTKHFIPEHAFADPNWFAGRATLICDACGCHFDPHSGLILSMGNPAKVPSDVPILDPK